MRVNSFPRRYSGPVVLCLAAAGVLTAACAPMPSPPPTPAPSTPAIDAADTVAAPIHGATTPHEASRDSLAAFAAAIRQAAASHDIVELRLVMSRDFSFSAIGAYGRDLALSAWISEEFRTLDRVPELLDRGLSPLGEWWVSPPEYASRLDYRGLRLGFRRTTEGRWEWVFLMRGEVE